MKLINISKSGETYSAKALHPIKILGIQITATIKTYKLSKDNSYWYDVESGKKVSKFKRLKLEKWLKDHQRFIEKK